MRWDEVLDREITAERLKERDTACCVHKDGAGCVQSPKTECSKIGDPVTNSVSGKSPKSKWVRIQLDQFFKNTILLFMSQRFFNHFYFSISSIL